MARDHRLSRRELLKKSAAVGPCYLVTASTASAKPSLQGQGDEEVLAELFEEMRERHGQIQIVDTEKLSNGRNTSFLQRYRCKDGTEFDIIWSPIGQSPPPSSNGLDGSGDSIKFAVTVEKGASSRNSSKADSQVEKRSVPSARSRGGKETYHVEFSRSEIESFVQNSKNPADAEQPLDEPENPETQSVDTGGPVTALSSHDEPRTVTLTSADDGESEPGGLPSLGSTWYLHDIDDFEAKAGVDAVHAGPLLTAEASVWGEHQMTVYDYELILPADITFQGSFSYQYSAFGLANAGIEIRIFIERDDDKIIDQRHLLNKGGYGLGYESNSVDFEYTFNDVLLNEAGIYRFGIEVYTEASAGPGSTAHADVYNGRSAVLDSVTIDWKKD